jgi:transcriptional regulator with XRE-family HTH domain
MAKRTPNKPVSDEVKRLRAEAGDYIRQLRTKREMSQLDLANRLGYDYYSFISQVENGTARVPPETLREWARVLGVSPKDFATTLLRLYEPFYFDAVFGVEHKSRSR